MGVGFGCETCGAAAAAAAAISVAVGERVLCVAMLALLQGGQAPRTQDKQGGHKIWAAGRCSGDAGAPTASLGQLLLLHVLCCACVHVQTPSIVAERQRRARRTNIHAIVAVAFSTCGDVLATPGLRCEPRLHSSAQRGRGPVDLPHTERVVVSIDLQTSKIFLRVQALRARWLPGSDKSWGEMCGPMECASTLVSLGRSSGH